MIDNGRNLHTLKLDEKGRLHIEGEYAGFLYQGMPVRYLAEQQWNSTALTWQMTWKRLAPREEQKNADYVDRCLRRLKQLSPGDFRALIVNNSLQAFVTRVAAGYTFEDVYNMKDITSLPLYQGEASVYDPVYVNLLNTIIAYDIVKWEKLNTDAKHRTLAVATDERLDYVKNSIIKMLASDKIYKIEGKLEMEAVGIAVRSSRLVKGSFQMVPPQFDKISGKVVIPPGFRMIATKPAAK